MMPTVSPPLLLSDIPLGSNSDYVDQHHFPSNEYVNDAVAANFPYSPTDYTPFDSESSSSTPSSYGCHEDFFETQFLLGRTANVQASCLPDWQQTSGPNVNRNDGAAWGYIRPGSEVALTRYHRTAGDVLPYGNCISQNDTAGILNPALARYNYNHLDEAPLLRHTAPSESFISHNGHLAQYNGPETFQPMPHVYPDQYPDDNEVIGHMHQPQLYNAASHPYQIGASCAPSHNGANTVFGYPQDYPQDYPPYSTVAPGFYADGTHSLRHLDYNVVEIPSPSSASERASPPVPEDNGKKPLTLACFFCRKRKIACGSPPLGSKDRTCNQCARRNLTCVYPLASRRGMRPKSGEDGVPLPIVEPTP